MSLMFHLYKEPTLKTRTLFLNWRAASAINRRKDRKEKKKDRGKKIQIEKEMDAEILEV